MRVSGARPVALAAAVALLTWGLAGPTWADTPSPSPSNPTASPSATPVPSPGSAGPSSPAVSTGPGPTPSTPPPSPRAAGEQEQPDLTLTVASVGGPVAGEYWEDLGSFGFSGTSDLADGSTVQVQQSGGGGAWSTVASATVTGGTFGARLPVEAAGAATFRASATGVEGAVVSSAPTTTTVRDATVSLSAPTKVDSLKGLPAHGTVAPARPGVEVHLDVHRSSGWHQVASATTAADGTWSASVGYGRGALKRYDLRATYHAVNRSRWERSATARFTRSAVLDAQVDGTSKADVAKTYRKGCPVGPSKLSTIHLNYYGRDKRMHRGVIIVRTDLRQEVVRGFGTALKHRYPVAKMKNPNAYGGNDPRQMKANNTSGFNCRKVVGNPYKMSPHSYGIAIDVNTVQNPYRDSRGKWWPSNGKKYRDRSPLKWGMLGKSSWLTKSLRKDHFFWGGLWNPGRDYQHFEYRG